MVHPDSQENDYTCQDISLGKQEANNMQVRTGYKDGRGKKNNCLGMQELLHLKLARVVKDCQEILPLHYSKK